MWSRGLRALAKASHAALASHAVLLLLAVPLPSCSSALCSSACRPQALAEKEGDGMAKMIFRKDTGEILGVHIIGLHAADLIHEASNAIATNQRVQARALRVCVGGGGAAHGACVCWRASTPWLRVHSHTFMPATSMVA